jgi:flavodoxin
MKSLIVCVSISRGNTRRVADRMAEVLQAEVAEPEAVNPEALHEYDLVGLGSGIYWMTAHRRLWTFVRALPQVRGVQAFTFFTSRAPEIPLLGYSKPLRSTLERKGFDVLGSFSCRGLDTAGPLRIIGGLNVGRPNNHDLDRAAAFAARLRQHVGDSPAAP